MKIFRIPPDNPRPSVKTLLWPNLCVGHSANICKAVENPSKYSCRAESTCAVACSAGLDLFERIWVQQSLNSNCVARNISWAHFEAQLADLQQKLTAKSRPTEHAKNTCLPHKIKLGLLLKFHTTL